MNLIPFARKGPFFLSFDEISASHTNKNSQKTPADLNSERLGLEDMHGQTQPVVAFSFSSFGSVQRVSASPSVFTAETCATSTSGGSLSPGKIPSRQLQSL